MYLVIAQTVIQLILVDDSVHVCDSLMALTVFLVHMQTIWFSE